MATSPSRTYVALGDSFSAGIGAPGEVPWPDLAARALPDEVCVHNLAVAGVNSADVVAHQLPRALELEPDLVSVVCGGNDVLLSLRPDLDAVARNIDTLLAALTDIDLVVCATYPEADLFGELRPRTRKRVTDGFAAVNVTIRAAAARHGALCLEWHRQSHRATAEHYADDGVHPSPMGHREVAEEFSAALAPHLSREEENR